MREEFEQYSDPELDAWVKRGDERRRQRHVKPPSAKRQRSLRPLLALLLAPLIALHAFAITLFRALAWTLDTLAALPLRLVRSLRPRSTAAKRPVLTRARRRLPALVVIGTAAVGFLAVSTALATAPANISPPTISGDPSDGSTLAAAPGEWSDATDFAYQWQRCFKYDDIVKADSPVAYWRLGDSSGTTASDASGNGNNATYIGAPTLGAAGLIESLDTSVDFDNSEIAGISSSASLSPSSAITLEAWVTADTLGPNASDRRTIIQKNLAYWLRVDNVAGTQMARMYIYTGGQWKAIGTPVVAGTTYHLVGTYDGANLRIYKNGVLANSIAQTGAISTNTNPVAVSEPNSSGWDGRIDEAAVYGSALSATAVATHHQVGSSPGGCEDIGGATEQTYNIASDDAGETLRVKVAASGPDGSAVAYSAPTQTISGAAPTNTDQPSISGDPSIGSVISATTGAWNGVQPISYAYQWYRCGYFANVRQDAPLSYWRFDETVAQTATDSSGNGRNGTYNKGPSVQQTGVLSGDPSSSVSLNGSTQNITVSPGVSFGSGDFTIEGWFNANANAATKFIFRTGGQTGNPNIQVRVTSTEKLSAKVVGSVTIDLNATPTVSGNGWHHFALTRSGTPTSTFTLYLDGAQADQKTGAPGSLNGATQLTTIGSDVTATAGTYQSFFKGELDETSTYSTALSTARIQAHYAAGRGVDDATTCSAISGATTADYTVQDADANAELAVGVTATNPHGNASAWSEAVRAGVGIPLNTETPTISGSTAVGQGVVVDPGTWAGKAPLTYSYQWNRCSYRSTVLADNPQVYSRLGELDGDLAVNEAGPNYYGAYSDVTLGLPGALGSDGDTAIGLPANSKVTWIQDAVNKFSIEGWFRFPQGGVPNDTSIVDDGLSGMQLRTAASGASTPGAFAFKVWNSGGTSASVTGTTIPTNGSVWYHVVGTYDGSTVKLYVNGVQEGSSANLTGAVRVGETRVLKPWGGLTDELAYYTENNTLNQTKAAAHYAARNCTAISGATSATYTVQSADVGKGLSATVTGQNSLGSAVASSRSKPISGIGVPVNLTRPAASGVAKVGSTLTATPGAWESSTPLTYTYQWQQCSYGTVVLYDGAIGYWPLDEAGGPTLLDASRNGLNATATSATYGIPGALGDAYSTAIHFDGNGSASVPGAESLDFGNTYSVEGWVRKDAGSKGGGIIGRSDGWSLGISSGTGKVYLNSNGTAVARSTTAVPNDGQYHHIVGTKSGGTRKVYVDGADVTDSSPVDLANAYGKTSPVDIGKGQDAGDLDEIAVYPTALTASDVQQHYNMRTVPCSDISGATATTYALTQDDFAKQVRAKVTATNTLGSAAAASLGSLPVTISTTFGLDLPSDAALVGTQTPNLSVTPVAYASQYQYEVSTDPLAVHVGKFESGWVSAASTTFAVPSSWGLEWDKTYYWHARVKFTNGLVSPWTEPRSFTVKREFPGSRDYWPMWSSGPLSVNLATGNLLLSVPSPTYPTANASMSASISYNSHSIRKNDYGLGKGWSLSGGTDFDNPPNTLVDLGIAGVMAGVEVHWSDGSADIYNQVGQTGTYKPPAGEGSQLIKASNGGYTLNDGSRIYVFGAADSGSGEAKLTRMEFVNANPGTVPLTYTFSADKKLTKITDAGGRILNLAWNSLNAASCPNALLCITGPDGVTWRYIGTSGSSGSLARVNNGTRDVLAISYDSNDPKRPIKIQNANDLNPAAASPGYNATHSVQIGYDASSRPTSISEGPITGQTPAYSTWTFAYVEGPVATSTATAAAHTIPAKGYPWEPNYGSASTLPAGTVRQAAGYTEVTPPNQQGQPNPAKRRVYYDGQFHPIEDVDVLGNATRKGWTLKDQLLWSEDELGNPTDYTYDAVTDAQLAVTGPDADGQGPLGRPVTRMRYDEEKIGTSSSAGSPTKGLQAFYYDNAYLAGRAKIQRTDANINFHWGAAGVSGLGVSQSYSVNWSGLIDVPETGSYVFQTYGEDGTRLTIDGSVAIDDWNGGSVKTRTSQALALKAGRHQIALSHFVELGGGQIELRWRCSNCANPVPMEVVPSSVLRPNWRNATSAIKPSGHVTFSHYGDKAGAKADYTLDQINGQNAITSFLYDPYGRETQKVTPRGNAGRTIDSSGNLTGAPDLRFATTYTYYAPGQTAAPPAACGAVAANQAESLKTTAQHGLAPVSNVYDAAGRVVATTGMRGTACTSYDAEGRVISKRDGKGHTTSFAYDPMGNALTSTNADGSVGRTRYDESGATIATIDELGRTTSSAHDPQGNVITKTSPLGGVTSSTFDAAGNQLAVIDPLGRTTSYSYDAVGRQLTTSTPLGNQTATLYDANGNSVEVTDARGGKTLSTYNLDGQLVRKTDALGNVTTSSYDELGRAASVSDARGNTTTYSYDLNGNKASTHTPDGGTRSFTYTVFDQLAAEVDPRGNTTTYEYDGDAKLTVTTLPTGEKTRSAYDWAGNVLVATDAAGSKTTFVYDARDRLVEKRSPLGELERIEYDAVGNVTSRTDPLGNITRYTYDGENRVLTTEDPLGFVTTSAYDLAGQLVAQTDAKGRTTSFTYDADGRRTAVAAPDGGWTRFVYDAAGNPITRTDAREHATVSTYDALNRLLSRRDPLDRVTTYAYDGAGNQITVVSANGNATPLAGDGTTTTTYDSMNRVTRVEYSDSTPSVTYTYDEAGNRLTMNDGDGTKTYTYDAANRLTAATRGGTSFTYSYDSAGRLASRTYPSGSTTTFSYDSNGRIATVARGGKTTAYTYDAVGQRTRTDLPNGWSQLATYDAAGRISDLRSIESSQTLAVATYTRDAVGNPTQITRDGVIESYSYDSLDRLTGVCYGGAVAGCAPGSLILYTYDTVGNRVAENRFGSPKSYTYDEADQLVETGSSSGQVSYMHDANGNQTQEGARTFSYDGTGRLVQVKDGASVKGTYSYDGSGNRVTATAAGMTTTFQWDELADLPRLALETSDSGTTEYLYGADELGFAKSAGDYYYHTDDLGSTVAITSSSGAIQSRTTYDPFGAVRTEAGGGPAGALKFAGQQLDEATGLYNLRARTYDPQIGRFLSVDPLEQDPAEPQRAAYLYANDRPSVLTDPSGLSALDTYARPRALEVAAAISLPAVMMDAMASVRTASGYSVSLGGNLGTAATQAALMGRVSASCATCSLVLAERGLAKRPKPQDPNEARIQEAWDFFTSKTMPNGEKAFTQEQVAAIVGNLMVESFQWHRVGEGGDLRDNNSVLRGDSYQGECNDAKNDGNCGDGIAQWDDARWTYFTKTFAPERNLKPGTLKAQLEFIWFELNNKYTVTYTENGKKVTGTLDYRHVLKSLRTTTGITQAANVFACGKRTGTCQGGEGGGYLNPGDPNMTDRICDGKALYNWMAKGKDKSMRGCSGWRHGVPT